MANYRTCHNCRTDRNECASLARIKQAIAGLSVTSIKFACQDRAPVYRTGDRVSVTWPVNASDGYDDGPGDWGEETWPATVIAEVGSKFLICVDDVASDFETRARDYIKSANLYCKVTAGKLKPLDEPKRSVCALCGIVGGNSFAGCWQEGVRPDSRCLRVITDNLAQTPSPIPPESNQ